MSRLDKIVEILEDCKPHSIKELREKVELEEDKLQKAVQFLEDFGIITKKEEEIRLKKPMPN